MFSDHMPVARKLPCHIITVDVEQKIIQGMIRSGPVHISVYTTDPLFRWPQVGDNWIIRQENGSWYLDSILQKGTEEVQLSEMQPGDVHLNAPNHGRVHLSTGTTLARKYTQIVGDGSKKEWVIAHGLNDLAVTVAAISTIAPNAPITAFTWAPVILESGAGDPSNLKVNFSSAPAKDGAQVVVTG